MSKKIHISTDLFKNKPHTPEFIKTHSLFKNPIKVQKVFPSIGLPNFREKVSIDKCLVDIRKEGSYVHNLLRIMTDVLVQTKDSVSHLADKLQYLDTKDVRERERAKLVELYSLSNMLTNLSLCTDPYNRDVLTNAIHTDDGKIALRLLKDIFDSNGKIMFRKDESLFKIFNKVKDKCTAFNIIFQNLEQMDVFKIFSRENIPNKEFNAIFSSEGEDGAWDIITMSMRGDWSSCQRWEGEYPRCLIGSVLSKFVGIIYLTSGVMNSGNEKNGNRSNLGTKMMRRCVVRYAIDADECKPCILLDKMYPELDKDVLAIFLSAISARTSLPVYYSQNLGNKMRHIYLPSEKIKMDVSNREWSYQDTPLKSKEDLNVYLLSNNKEEIEREIKGFKLNLGLFLARRMEAVYSGNIQVSDTEIKKTIFNIRLNTSFTPFCEQVVESILGFYRAPTSNGFTNSRSYYRKYLMDLLVKRKGILVNSSQSIEGLLVENTSRTFVSATFVNYIFTLVTEFTKQEIANLIN